MITSFRGEYRFLSNFYPTKFLFQGFEWSTAEHAYQAMKKVDLEYWKKLLDPSVTAADAKRLGREVDIDSSFHRNRIHYMRMIVNAKFGSNPELMKMLRETAPHELVEGNTWGDTFWGQCPIGNGRNELGKILMTIRDSVFYD